MALEGDKQSISKSQDLNVATQEFSFMMQAASNAIKTIGEGMNAMARKG